MDAESIAKEQAAKDAALLEALRQKFEEENEPDVPVVITSPDVAEEAEEAGLITRMPMNRAERRQQVKLYAMVLAGTERQTPIRNPTIIPRRERRRRKQHRA